MKVASVLAIVLTHDAPESLERCLAAIAGQTHRPDVVLVVDNASSPPAAPEEHPGLVVVVHRSEHNGGPAGGHAIGLGEFMMRDERFAWVMDDDCIPEPGCLEALLAAHRASAEDLPVFPLWIDGITGAERFMPAWCGFLMSRGIIAMIGLPREDLVWWTEDTEYLQDRLRRAHREPIEAPLARVDHHRVRTFASKPAWKYYYEVRNTIEYRFYVQDRTAVRVVRMTKSVLALVVQILRSQPGKADRLRAVVDGVNDGVRRRSGLRYALSSKS